MNQNQINVGIFAYLLDMEDYARNNTRLERRMLRDMLNPFEVPLFKFLKDFRLQKATVINIIQELEPYVDAPSRSDAIPFHLKLLTSLYFFANGSDQSCIGNLAWGNMSQPAVSRAINMVSRLITNHLSNHIKFPKTHQEKLNIQEGFYNRWGMRGVIGAVDGTHVEIVQPPITDVEHLPHLYINRKGKFTINICDSECNILSLNARYPGSVHDAAIWHTSGIRQHLMEASELGDNSCLIGDSGYGVEPWLLTPFNNPAEGSPEFRFNVSHRRARNVVERTNGILKARFRCLSKFRILQYHPITAAYIIYACGILHNIVSTEVLGREDDYIEIDDPQIEPLGHIVEVDNDIMHRGRQARDRYVAANY